MRTSTRRCAISICRSREGAWIEIGITYRATFHRRVAPARERGLKSGGEEFIGRTYIVAPARERGLKFLALRSCKIKLLVAPARERGLKYRGVVK